MLYYFYTKPTAQTFLPQSIFFTYNTALQLTGISIPHYQLVIFL